MLNAPYIEKYNGSYTSNDRKEIRYNLDKYLSREGIKTESDFIRLSPEGDEIFRTGIYHFRDATVALVSKEFPSNHRSIEYLMRELEVKITASDVIIAEGLGKRLKEVAVGRNLLKEINKMETQQENRFAFGLDQYPNLRDIKIKLEKYVQKNEGIAIGFPQVSNKDKQTLIQVTYFLNGSMVNLTETNGSRGLVNLEVEVNSDDERTKTSLLSKLKEIALN